MYVAKLSVLIEAIWLKGTWGKNVNNKLMLLVTLVELQKLVNWAQVATTYILN
jgi:hypothetical protein